MKEIVKHKSFYHYLIIATAIILAGVCLYATWLFFSAPVNRNEKVVQVAVTKKTDNSTKTDSVKKPVVTPVVTELSPDYSIPPIVDGTDPVITTLPTKQKIVFLGIDDGAYKDQSVVDMMRQNDIKASLFLTKSAISDNPDFFKQLIAQGSFVEDHTINHDTNMVRTENYEQQKADICGMSDYELAHYGRRPIFFRPPGGEYSTIMRQAAAACGMRAVVDWIAKANGGAMQYQIGDKLRPGDIVLMHFRPEFKQDMAAFVDAMKAAGLHTALLEDAMM